jgi:hypothetical protein
MSLAIPGVRVALSASPRVIALSRASAATRAYITAVEFADGQQLESSVLAPLVEFANWRIPLGGACCMFMGPRTLTGAFVPMIGPAPTGVNLVSGDYSRTLGIKGNATTKSINLNYTNGAYGTQDNRLAGVRVSEKATTNNDVFMGGLPASGRMLLRSTTGPGVAEGIQYAVNGFTASILNNYTVGFLAACRQDSADQSIYNAGTTQTNASASQAPSAFAMFLLQTQGDAASFCDGRVQMCTDSAYIDPAVFDARLSSLVNAIATALA